MLLVGGVELAAIARHCPGGSAHRGLHDCSFRRCPEVVRHACARVMGSYHHNRGGTVLAIGGLPLPRRGRGRAVMDIVGAGCISHPSEKVLPVRLLNPVRSRFFGR